MRLNDEFEAEDFDGDDVNLEGSGYLFESLPAVDVDPQTGCWIPIDQPRTPKGYVRVTIFGRPIRMHRFTFAIVNGGLRPSEVVRHTCDRRACCNPAHLIRGTHVDNVADRVARDRSATGSKNGRAKFTDEQAIEIYCDRTKTTAEKAAWYKVHPDTIKAIEDGHSYKKATAPYRESKRPDASAN